MNKTNRITNKDNQDIINFLKLNPPCSTKEIITIAKNWDRTVAQIKYLCQAYGIPYGMGKRGRDPYALIPKEELELYCNKEPRLSIYTISAILNKSPHVVRKSLLAHGLHEPISRKKYKPRVSPQKTPPLEPSLTVPASVTETEGFGESTKRHLKRIFKKLF
jgi:hypothetical protein